MDLQGRGRNRDAVGAKLTATVGSRRIVREVNGGGSYISSHDRRVHFGLGRTDVVDRLEVVWPSGGAEVKTNVPVGTAIRWEQSTDP